MVKNAIHVFYTKPEQVGTSFFGFPNIRLFYMSVFLSLKCLQDKNYRVKLVTDKLGKKYLIDNFGLPYDEVTTELEDAEINPYLWGMAKMHAFSIQTEPFLYVDLDVFLFNDISNELKKGSIFFQNHEINYYTAYDTFSRFNHYFKYDMNHVIKEYVKDTKYYNSYGDAYNTAVFGGNNIDLIKKACEDVLKYCRNNMSGVNNKQIGDRLSVFMEQVYLHYYLVRDEFFDRSAYYKNVPLFHIKDNITERLDFYNKWRDDYVHMITFEKFNPNLIKGMTKAIEKTNFETLEMNTWGVNYVDLLALTRDLQ